MALSLRQMVRARDRGRGSERVAEKMRVNKQSALNPPAKHGQIPREKPYQTNKRAARPDTNPIRQLKGRLYIPNKAQSQTSQARRCLTVETFRLCVPPPAQRVAHYAAHAHNPAPETTPAKASYYTYQTKRNTHTRAMPGSLQINPLPLALR